MDMRQVLEGIARQGGDVSSFFPHQALIQNERAGNPHGLLQTEVLVSFFQEITIRPASISCKLSLILIVLVLPHFKMRHHHPS